jgi:uncharacterized NAD-dependent epimerase/dehydratase family protein
MTLPEVRLAILAEASFGPLEAKTAVGMLRYRPARVAAVIDSTQAGRTAAQCAGVGGDIPVVASVDEAAALGAGALLIGIAPAGGRLPDSWRPVLRRSLERGWDVISGLHAFLSDDPELSALARAHQAQLHDLRRPPRDLRVALGRASRVDALIVLTVGTDCNSGKMTAALEVQRELVARGLRAAFVATGQTGIVIEGRGTAIDAVPADFVAGAAEALVLEAARDADVVIVEGQGSLFHPGFSGVTLGLLHGACPEALILCHHWGRERLRISSPDVPVPPPVPPLGVVREAYERAASWVRPAPVVAAAVNTRACGEPEARAACSATESELGVPTTDPVRFGAATLADAVAGRRTARGPALPAR